MSSPAPQVPSENNPLVSADEALRWLIEGNARYVRGESKFTGMRPEVLADLAKGQQPFATVLGCSDARVPPELIFDAVLGELFVIRVAGNVLSPEVVGSLQYAGVHLRTPLFVVLGHEGCGAVQAALESKVHGTQHHSRIQILVENIIPAIRDLPPAQSPKEQLALAVEANVRWSMRQLLESPEGRARAAEGAYKLVGAIYDITSGCVRFLETI